MVLVVYLFLIVINLSLFICGKRAAKAKAKAGTDTEGFYQDITRDDRPDVYGIENLSTTFPSFWFHAEPNGFLWIGDFLLQWVQAKGNEIFFMLEFDIPMGTFTTSYALNTGGKSALSPLFYELTPGGVKLQGTRCEHPQFTLSYGIKYQKEHATRITYNKQETRKKSWAFKTRAHAVADLYIPEIFSPVNACPEVKRKKTCVIS